MIPARRYEDTDNPVDVFLQVLIMKTAIESVVLLMILCNPGLAQQATTPFQIVDPNFSASIRRASDERYFAFAEPRQQPMRQTQPSGVNEPGRFPDVDGLTKPIEIERESTGRVPRAGIFAYAGSTEPIQSILVAGHVESPYSSTASFVMPVGLTKNCRHRSHHSTVSYGSDAHDAAEIYVDPATRRHLLFGVDREACRDEWDGFCNCGGFHDGHHGHSGIQGCAQCVGAEKVHGKHKHKKCSRCNR